MLYGPVVRIGLADGHQIFREGLRRLLEAERDFAVVGEAGDGEEAAAMARQLKPDLLLRDVRASDYDAICFLGGEGCDVYAARGSHAEEAKRLIDEALAEGKLVTSIGMGGVVLAEAGVLQGRQATCYPFGEPPGIYVRRLEAAGAVWRDEPVVEDGPFITQQTPRDVNLFARALLRRLGVEPPIRAAAPDG